VTPIADMLEISALDRSPADEPPRPNLRNHTRWQDCGTRRELCAAWFGSGFLRKRLRELPEADRDSLVFNGFSEKAIQLFAGQLERPGIVPVMGAGSDER